MGDWTPPATDEVVEPKSAWTPPAGDAVDEPQKKSPDGSVGGTENTSQSSSSSPSPFASGKYISATPGQTGDFNDRAQKENAKRFARDKQVENQKQITLDAFKANPEFYSDPTNRDNYYSGLAKVYNPQEIDKIRGEDKTVFPEISLGAIPSQGYRPNPITGKADIADLSKDVPVLHRYLESVGTGITEGAKQVQEAGEMLDKNGADPQALLHGIVGMGKMALGGATAVVPEIAAFTTATNEIGRQIPLVQDALTPSELGGVKEKLKQSYKDSGQEPPSWIDDTGNVVDFIWNAFLFHQGGRAYKEGKTRYALNDFSKGLDEMTPEKINEVYDKNIKPKEEFYQQKGEDPAGKNYADWVNDIKTTVEENKKAQQANDAKSLSKALARDEVPDHYNELDNITTHTPVSELPTGLSVNYNGSDGYVSRVPETNEIVFNDGSGKQEIIGGGGDTRALAEAGVTLNEGKYSDKHGEYFVEKTKDGNSVYKVQKDGKLKPVYENDQANAPRRDAIVNKALRLSDAHTEADKLTSKAVSIGNDIEKAKNPETQQVLQQSLQETNDNIDQLHQQAAQEHSASADAEAKNIQLNAQKEKLLSDKEDLSAAGKAALKPQIEALDEQIKTNNQGAIPDATIPRIVKPPKSETDATTERSGTESNLSEHTGAPAQLQAQGEPGSEPSVIKDESGSAGSGHLLFSSKESEKELTDLSKRSVVSSTSGSGEPVVLSLLHNDGIFNSVISSVPVEVMNDLGGKKFSAEELRHNKSVFSDRLASNGDNSVSERVIASLSDGVATLRTKLLRALTLGDAKDIATLRTYNLDRSAIASIISATPLSEAETRSSSSLSEALSGAELSSKFPVGFDVEGLPTKLADFLDSFHGQKLLKKSESQNILQPGEENIAQNHEAHFDLSGEHEVQPLEKLIPTKDEEHLAGKAEEKFRAAEAGKSKREPITVRPAGGGKFEVIDGNKTLAAAKKNGWTDLPVKFETRDERHARIVKEVNEAKPEFQKAQDEILKVSKDVLAETGVEGFSSNNVLKNPKRIAEKAIDENYEARGHRWDEDTHGIKDYARNDVVVSDAADTQKIVDALRAKYPETIKDQPNHTNLGFKSHYFVVRTENGKMAEIQVIPLRMYIAKEGFEHIPESHLAEAKNILKQAQEKLGSPAPDGMGHLLYEIYRSKNEKITEDTRKAIIPLSNEYYAAFADERNSSGTLDSNSSLEMPDDSSKPESLNASFEDRLRTVFGGEKTSDSPLEEYLTKQPESVKEYISSVIENKDTKNPESLQEPEVKAPTKSSELPSFESPLPKGSEPMHEASFAMPGISSFLNRDVQPLVPKTVAKAKAFFQSILNNIKNWYNPDSAKAETKALLRPYLADVAQKKDAAWAVLRARHRWWNKVPEDVKTKFMNQMEHGNISNDDFKALGYDHNQAITLSALAKEYRSRLEAAHALDLTYKEKAEYIENYFPHMWEKPDKATQVFSAMVSKMNKQSFEKMRTIDFIEEGIKKGLKLRTTNPEEIVLQREFGGHQRKAMNDFMDKMEKQGLIRYVYPNAETGKFNVPDGFKKLSDDSYNRLKIYSPDGKGTPVFAAGADEVVKNYLSPSLYGRQDALGKAYRANMTIKNAMVSVKLLSGYHIISTSLSDVTTQMNLAMRQLLRGNPKGLLSAIKSPLSPFIDLGSQLGKGDVMKAWDKYQAGEKITDPEMAEAIDLIKRAGGRAHLSEVWQHGINGRFADAVDEFKNGNYPGSAIRAVSASFGLVQKVILEQYVGRLKLNSYLKLANDYMATTKETSELEQNKALQKMWDSMDNRFGQLVYDNLFWNRLVRDLGTASTLSLGWNLGTFREFGGAFKDIPDDVMKSIKSGKPEVSDRILFAAAYPVIVGAIGGLMTYLQTGQQPNTLLDYFYPASQKDEDGKTTERLQIPSMMKEFFSGKREMESKGALKGTATYLGNKLAPEFSTIMDLLKNEDYYGIEISNPNDPRMEQVKQMGEYLGKSLLPIFMGSLEKQKAEGDKSSPILPIMGFNAAPRYITNTKVENEIYDLYQARNRGIKPYGSREEKELRQKLNTLTENGDDDAANQLLEDAMKEGALRPAQVKSLLVTTQKGKANAAVYMFQHLPYSDREHLYKQMSDPEKEQFDPEGKFQNALDEAAAAKEE